MAGQEAWGYQVWSTRPERPAAGTEYAASGCIPTSLRLQGHPQKHQIHNNKRNASGNNGSPSRQHKCWESSLWPQHSKAGSCKQPIRWSRLQDSSHLPHTDSGSHHPIQREVSKAKLVAVLRTKIVTEAHSIKTVP